MSAYSARIRRRRTHAAGASRVIIILMVVLVLGLGGAIAGSTAYVLHIANSVDLSDLKPRTAGAVSEVFALDGGKRVRLGLIKSDVLRTVLTGKAMPQTSATRPSRSRTRASTSTAASTSRASSARAIKNLQRRDVQGGSTLTMQLSATSTRDRTAARR